MFIRLIINWNITGENSLKKVENQWDPPRSHELCALKWQCGSSDASRTVPCRGHPTTGALKSLWPTSDLPHESARKHSSSLSLTTKLVCITPPALGLSGDEKDHRLSGNNTHRNQRWPQESPLTLRSIGRDEPWQTVNLIREMILVKPA